MRAMATQVEVGSTLPSLTTRSELTSETKLQHAFASSLSDTSHKPGEHPSSLSPLVLEERSKFGSPLRPVSMPPTIARPRLTPKPFSREKSSDTFLVVKPPVPALKPNNIAPNPSTFAKTVEDMTVCKGLTGNVPPLVDQKSIEDKSPSELVANMPFDSSPQANTVILFETGKSEKGKMKFTPEESSLGSPQMGSTLQAPEGHLPPSKSETFCRTAGIHRQLSLSSEFRPVSWNPGISLEKKDHWTGPSEEKGKVVEKPYSAGVSPASEVQLRPKQRPVSVIFLESLKEQRQCCLEFADEKSLPEKTWVRKPRPLSMDLTAKFENRDLSLQRKSYPTETKEKNLSTGPTKQGSVRPSERGTTNEAAALDRADLSKSSLTSPGPFADFASVLNPKPFPREEASSCQSTQKDFSQVSARDRKCLWESRLKRHDEQNAREMETETTPENLTEPSNVKGQPSNGRALLNPKEPCAARKNCAGGSCTENQSLRDIEKPVNVPDRSANDATSVNVGSQPESLGEENKVMNVQQRIKELTAENADLKPGSLRRRSRPLSADLTKLFSSPVLSSEPKSEKGAELNRKPASKTPESQEIKADPLLGTDSGETHARGVLWRPQQPVKILHLQRDGSFSRERHSGALQGDSLASLADHDVHANSTSPVEKACIKTVRATMFEHHVQRHKVTADLLGAELPSQLTNELSGNCRGWWMGKAAGPKRFSKEEPCRQPDVLRETKKPGKTNSFNKDRDLQDTPWKKYPTMEKCENPSGQNVEDSLACQKIEPRYEVLQTVGKRAQSEAVAIVCEDKAVTLRSRRSLKERRKPGESFADASWSRSLDLKGDCWKEDSFVAKMQEGGEMAEKADTWQALDTSLGQPAFCEQVTELDKNETGQKHVTVAASYVTNRNKDVGATDDRVSVVFSELEKEKSKGKAEGSKVPKHFPENFGARPSRTAGGEARAHASHSTVAGRPSESGSYPSGGESSQWQTVSSKVPHHSADVKNYEQEEAKGFGSQKYPSARGVQETLDGGGHRPKGHPLQHLETQEQVKRSSRRTSAGKVSERWRRKTLPHDIRFEDVGSLAEEGAKGLIRRDSLQFHEDWMAKKSRKPRCAVEPKEGTLVSPSSPEDHFKDQASPSKPKATYFAVTCQIPNEAEGSSGKEFPHQGRWFSSLVENTSFASNAGAPGGSPPSSGRQFGTAMSGAVGSLDRRFAKNWEEAGEGDASALLKKGALKSAGSEGREESWRSLERQVEDAKDRIPGTGPSLHSAARSSPGEQKAPSYLRHFHQDGEHSGQKKHDSDSYGVPKEKHTDSYRSKVLDIDALMAEYKEDSLKPSVTQDRREGEDGSLFPWEKSRRCSSDKPSFSYSQKDLQALDDSPRSPRQDVYRTEVIRPENVGLSERERWASQEPSPVQCRDGKFSPPPWGRPSALSLPADAAGTKKKTFLLDEDLGGGLTLSSQGARYVEYKMQIPDPLCLDLKAEAGSAPHPSSAPADSISQRGTCPKQQVRNVPPEGDQHNASGQSKRKSSVAGSPCKSQAEWNTSALANALPHSKHLYSEKAHQAKAKGSLPVGPEGRERRDLHKARQSFPPEQAEENVRQRRRSASQQRSLFCREKKGLENEQSQPDAGSPRVRSSARGLGLQGRSRSFFWDRRVDHWAADQLKQCFGRPAAEAKDTDSLVREADSQYGTWSDQRHSGDSLAPESPSSESNVASARRQPPSSRLSSFSSQTDPASMTDPHGSSRDQRSASLDRSSTDVESADGAEGPAPAETCPDFSFPEQTTVLDSSALKTRVQLSKRRRQHRAPISHHLLRRSSGGGTEQPSSVTEEAGSAWMFRDSTEKSAKLEESEEEEGKLPPPSERLPSSQPPQRQPVFPGLDPSALKVQLRRRQEPEGGGGASPGQLSRSPKSTFQPGGPGVRVLPAGPEKEERVEEASPSPQWLKELKSKKRQSQYENQV